MAKPSSRAPIAYSPLSLVLVAHNAAADIEAVVAAWIAQLEARKCPFEVILVDDGSTDDTPALADQLVKHHDRLRVIHHPMPMGFGAAIRAGIAAARHPLLAYCTCDRQYEPTDLKRLLSQIDKVDVVTGFRTWMTVPTPLRWLGKAWRVLLRVLLGVSLDPLPTWLGDHGQRKRWLSRWVFGVRVLDVDCAFRVMRREILARIPVQSNGPFAQAELLAKANFLGCLMAETPVAYHPPAGPPLHGSLNPYETYRREALRVFRHPEFSA